MQPERRDPRQYVQSQLLTVTDARADALRVTGHTTGDRHQLLVKTQLFHH